MQYVHNLFNAIERIPDANTLPDFVDRDVRQGEDYSRLDKLNLRQAIKDDLTALIEPYAERRRGEQQLAGYIENIANSLDEDLDLKEHLLSIACQMNACRNTGRIFKEDNETYFAWDYKCSQTKLCPDESREESQRLAEFYLPELLNYAKEDGRNRVFYSVFTDKNYSLGELANGKKEIIEKFKQFTRTLKYFAQNAERKHATNKNNKTQFAGAYCPVEFFDVHGEQKRIRSFIKDIVYPPDAIVLDGSLIIQEDPLSARGDWNVHINVFLLIKGQFDWALARDLWNKNVYFKEVKKDAFSFRKTLLEAIKYSAQILPVKSKEKAQQGKTLAPWMCDWEKDTWMEWFKANKAFRRTRAYGCLYKVHERRWNEMPGLERARVVTWAEVENDLIGVNFNKCLWSDVYSLPDGLSGDKKKEHLKLRNKIKTKLRAAMQHGEPDPDGYNAELIGKVIFTECGSYSVSSTRGNNFFESSRDLLADNYFNDPGGGYDEQSYSEYTTFKTD